MPLTNRTFRIETDARSLGLSCTAAGVSLAGVPLLRNTVAGWTPRSREEIGALMKGAYGRDLDPAGLSDGLEVIAKALNRGDTGRAMVAALRLKLPELSREGAARIAHADDVLAKYDEAEPRDWRGRWTTDGGSDDENARLIPIANNGSSAAQQICLDASRQCQINALQDKSGRTPYFPACQEAETTCLLALRASPLKADQMIGVIFPDRTVVMILNGRAIVARVGGVKVPR